MDELTKYTAQDGTQITLSPEIVVKEVLNAQDLSDRQLYSFIAKCQARKLNPLAGDCFLAVFKGQATVIVSKDYYMQVAAKQPTYDGLDAGVVVITRDGTLEYRQGALVGGQTEKLVGGWAKVYDKARSHPSEAVVSFAEYAQDNTMWKSKPATMIRKVAVVQALREAYPAQFSGLYDQTEINNVQDDSLTIDVPQTDISD